MFPHVRIKRANRQTALIMYNAFSAIYFSSKGLASKGERRELRYIPLLLIHKGHMSPSNKSHIKKGPLLRCFPVFPWFLRKFHSKVKWLKNFLCMLLHNLIVATRIAKVGNSRQLCKSLSHFSLSASISK